MPKLRPFFSRLDMAAALSGIVFGVCLIAGLSAISMLTTQRAISSGYQQSAQFAPLGFLNGPQIPRGLYQTERALNLPGVGGVEAIRVFKNLHNDPIDRLEFTRGQGWQAHLKPTGPVPGPDLDAESLAEMPNRYPGDGNEL